jgi:hypothetical protein
MLSKAKSRRFTLDGVECVEQKWQVLSDLIKFIGLYGCKFLTFLLGGDRSKCLRHPLH